MIRAKSYDTVFKFVKLMARILVASFFPDTVYKEESLWAPFVHRCGEQSCAFVNHDNLDILYNYFVSFILLYLICTLHKSVISFWRFALHCILSVILCIQALRSLLGCLWRRLNKMVTNSSVSLIL